MNERILNRKLAGIDPWSRDYGESMERRTEDGMSWYDLSINGNSIPCQTDFAIIVTSWMGQLKWLKYVLARYRESGAFVILAYDNPFYSWGIKNEAQDIRCMPNPNHYVLANSVVHKHITYDSDKRNGWFWDVRYAQGILRSFPNIKYVYCTNGDCVCENPDGFRTAIDMMGDADLLAGQGHDDFIHTANMLFKVDAFHRIFDQMYEWMRVPVLGSRSPEGLLMLANKVLGTRVKHAPVQPRDPSDGTIDNYARYDQASTWKEILGFKNLFAIQETCWNEGREPLPAKYFDPYHDWIYFSGEEKESICQYYATGDRRYLMMWWDRGEDSDYNRLYYPLDHYGKEPIYERPAGETIA
jgi:hypothetical protein